MFARDFQAAKYRNQQVVCGRKKVRGTLMMGKMSLLVLLILLLDASYALANTWTRRVTSGERPKERSTPAVATLHKSIYLFGGVKDDFSNFQNTFYNDLYRFNTSNDTWNLLTPQGILPPPRAFAASVGVEHRGLIFLFGGANYSPTFSNFITYDDLWVYNVAANTWKQLHPVNSRPVGRSRPNLWVVGDRLYLFGGFTASSTTLNDLWVYDIRTNTWTEIIPNGTLPPARHEAQAGDRVQKGKLTVYGGETIDSTGNFQTLNDTWEFDLRTNTWKEVTPIDALNITPARNYGSATVINNNLFLHGGDLPGGETGCGSPFPQNPTEELWRFDLVKRIWTQVQPDGDPLVRLKRTNAAKVGNRMYIFGGYDFQCSNQTGLGQIWNLDVYSYEPFKN
ncbi:Kelch repeat-containing protein [Scytonema sp. NUACC26]|uniref:Kelch repeat-containing protein n=1 Tax=Scytonema sp. NUACC26 TaxID=3140176 RepID=UPI0034DBFF9E